MNYTYLASHRSFISFIRRLNESETMSADYTGVLDEPAFNNLGELIDFLGGDSDKYNKESYEEETDEDGKVWEVEYQDGNILDYGPFSVEPKHYPAIAVWFFENSFDRMGDVSTKILNFISIPELKRKKEIRSQMNEVESQEYMDRYAEQMREEYKKRELKKKKNIQKYILEKGVIRVRDEHI